MARPNLKLNQLSPWYIKVMVIVAMYLRYPQRVYHKMSGAQNVIIRGLVPFMIPLILVSVIPAYVIGFLALMLESKRQQRLSLKQDTNSNTEPCMGEPQSSDNDANQEK